MQFESSLLDVVDVLTKPATEHITQTGDDGSDHD